MIEQADIDRLKEIFITRQECNSQMDDVDAKLNNDQARLAVIESKLETVTKLEWAVLIAVLTAIVGALMGLILK